MKKRGKTMPCNIRLTSFTKKERFAEANDCLCIICIAITIIIITIIIVKRLVITKRGSRHAAHAAKALRWRVDQLIKSLIKK